MLLALDLGNTFLKAGLLSKTGEVRWENHIRHHHSSLFLNPCLLHAGAGPSKKDFWPEGITEVRLASVVPRLTKSVQRHLIRLFDLPVKILKREDLPLKVTVTKPWEVGIDRLLNTLAAGSLYRKPVVVVDCGTALTFDLVTLEGNYAGGIITLSPELARDSLADRTALLPRIELKKPKSVVGKNTVECLRAGLVLGFADLITGLLRRLEKEWEPKFTVVGTGGGLPLLLPHLSPEVIFDLHLSLKGIFLSK